MYICKYLYFHCVDPRGPIQAGRLASSCLCSPSPSPHKAIAILLLLLLLGFSERQKKGKKEIYSMWLGGRTKKRSNYSSLSSSFWRVQSLNSDAHLASLSGWGPAHRWLGSRIWQVVTTVWNLFLGEGPYYLVSFPCASRRFWWEALLLWGPLF